MERWAEAGAHSCRRATAYGCGAARMFGKCGPKKFGASRGVRSATGMSPLPVLAVRRPPGETLLDPRAGFAQMNHMKQCGSFTDIISRGELAPRGGTLWNTHRAGAWPAAA